MEGEEKLKEIISKIEEETNFETIKEMKVILNKVFGEENNQIIKPTVENIVDELTRYGSLGSLGEALNVYDKEQLQSWLMRSYPHVLNYTIVVYFPEVEITDGKRKHTIKELYVRTIVKPSGLLDPKIFGLRAYLSHKEAINHYVHSHLRAAKPSTMQFSQFCTGEGPINQVMLLLSTKFTIPNFMLFCLHLKNFVAWESRDGRPYMYIENIGVSAEPANPYPELYSATKRKAAITLLKQIKSLNIKPEELYPMFKFSIRKGGIMLVQEKAFELYAGEIMREWNPSRLFGTSSPIQSFLHGIDNAGRVCALRKPNTSISYNRDRVLLTFKENNIKLKIEESNETETQLEKVIPNREITNIFCKELAILLTNSAFTNARAKPGNSRTNISKAPDTSTVHVQTGME